LSTKGTIDDLVLSILLDKIGLFKMAIGEIDSILADFGDEFDFEDRIAEVVGGSNSTSEIEAKLHAFAKQIRVKLDARTLETSYSQVLMNELVPKD
jgi:hypothetical protein